MIYFAADANPWNRGLGRINAVNKGCHHYLSDEDYDVTARYIIALDALKVARLKFAQLCRDAQSAELTPPASPSSLASRALRCDPPLAVAPDSLDSQSSPLAPSSPDRKRKRIESPAHSETNKNILSITLL